MVKESGNAERLLELCATVMDLAVLRLQIFRVESYVTASTSLW